MLIQLDCSICYDSSIEDQEKNVSGQPIGEVSDDALAGNEVGDDMYENESEQGGQQPHDLKANDPALNLVAFLICLLSAPVDQLNKYVNQRSNDDQQSDDIQGS